MGEHVWWPTGERKLLHAVAPAASTRTGRSICAGWQVFQPRPRDGTLPRCHHCERIVARIPATPTPEEP